MGSEHQYELRNGSRSRSLTPMILNHASTEMEQVEHNYDLRSKSRERSYTPGEVTSSRHSATRSLSNSVTKTREDVSEIPKDRHETENPIQTGRDNRSRTPDNLKSDNNNLNRRMERRSERQRIKRQIFTNGRIEANDNVSNYKVDSERQSMMTSDYFSEEGDQDDTSISPTSAYNIYKQAGDWWNVFPKTDYTYAESSECRYEIAPGILAMPNMSRRSIHLDNTDTRTQNQNSNLLSHKTIDGGLDTTDDKHYKDALNQMKMKLNSNTTQSNTTYFEEKKNYKNVIHTEPEEASNVRNRFSWKNSTSNSHHYNYSSPVDSDAELELIQSNSTEHTGIVKWLKSPFTLVAFLVIKMLEFFRFKSTQRKQHYYYNYRRHEVSKMNKVWNFITHYLPYPYLLLAKVLLLDSWLLSRVSEVRKQSKARGSRILWTALFLLLLLGGIASFLPPAKFLRDTKERVLIDNKGVNARPNLEGNLSDDWKVTIENLQHRLKYLETEDSSQKKELTQIGDLLKELKLDHNNFLKQYHEKNTNFNNNEEFRINNIKSELASFKEIYSNLKSCCENAEVSTSERMDQQMERSLNKYFGNTFSREELVTVLRSVMLSQQQKVEKKDSNEQVQINDDYVRKIVEHMLRVYDADKTGKVDYALESAGGQIISIRCTQRYRNSRVFKLLGFTLYHESNNPRTVIQGNPIQPGACWAFQDFPGYLLIKLRCAIRVTGFTLEHAPRSILPNGEMKSAPRKFNVWGLNDENDMEPVLFGDYEFLDSEHNLQYFPVQNSSIIQPFEYIELRIDNNHGQLEYTCLYRFRVHGTPL